MARELVVQIAGSLIIKNKNGHFTIAGHDTAGKHTYILHFLPAPSSQYAESQTTKNLIVPLGPPAGRAGTTA